MAPKERATPTAKTPAPNVLVEEFGQLGRKQAEAMVDMQKVIINTFERMNRDWLARDWGSSNPATSLAPAQPAESLQRPAAAITELQKEFIDSLNGMTQAWAARVTAEVDLAAAFVETLATSRSMPDAAAACQSWMGKRMELIFEDGRRLAAENQKVMTATARFFASGWTGDGA
jgi:hypothetical protein